MTKFLMKSFLLISVLLFGVLLGMQQANNGIRLMKGFDDSFQGAFEIAQTESGELEAGVLGEKVTAHDLEKKQQELEKIDAFNLFSSMGSALSDFVTDLFRKIMSLAFATVDKLYHQLG